MATKTIAQLTTNPAPASTNLIETDDGVGGSWKSPVSDIQAAIAPLNFQWTGTLPDNFPFLISAGAGGYYRIQSNGSNAATALSGIAIHSSFVFADPRSLLTSLSSANLVRLSQ